jgi:carbonic anhydrase/acetyltransferase-like protein (isoleucine patch superfamily)
MKRCMQALSLCAALLVAGCGGDSNNDQPIMPNVPESFVDPTVTLGPDTQLGRVVYVAPFARLNGRVRIGSESNVQDNVTLDGDVTVGDKVILAHGCSVVGTSRVGASGGLPAFVGFNARVDGATVEPDAMVGIRARLGPGLTLHSGRKILPGRNVTTQAEADDPALGKVAPVTPEDRVFMGGVLTVNRDLAVGYVQMEAFRPSYVRGVGPDPSSPLNPEQIFPTLGGQQVADPSFRNRIIGDLVMADPLGILASKMGFRDSIRADEGGPFRFGTLASMGDEVTVHALEDSEITVGNNFRVGRHAVIHGGEDHHLTPAAITTIGDNVSVGDEGVVFASVIGENCTIGDGAIVANTQLPANTVVPPKTIMISGVNQGEVQW